MPNYANQLNALYYGTMIAMSHSQSSHARCLWFLAEDMRKAHGFEEYDESYVRNREIAHARLFGG